MSGLVENLGFKKKTHVGVSLSANNFIELVCVDDKTKSVVKYASGNIKYNNAIREIIDYDEFTEVLEGLFDEAGLDPSQCAVTLNLPNNQKLKTYIYSKEMNQKLDIKNSTAKKDVAKKMLFSVLCKQRLLLNLSRFLRV